jgi:hypothetical protein
MLVWIFLEIDCKDSKNGSNSHVVVLKRRTKGQYSGKNVDKRQACRQGTKKINRHPDD